MGHKQSPCDPNISPLTKSLKHAHAKRLPQGFVQVGIAESDGSAGWTHQKNGPSAADVSRRRTVLARGGASGFQAPPAYRIRCGTARTNSPSALRSASEITRLRPFK